MYVNNVARGSDQPCSSDCFAHAKIHDSCRVFPWSIIVSCRLANFERTSWSTQRCHKFRGLRDELATATDFDKFLECPEDNYPGVCNGRSLRMIDCRELGDPDCYKNLGIHVGRNPRIMRSTLGSKDYHELHRRLNEDPPFPCCTCVSWTFGKTRVPESVRNAANCPPKSCRHNCWVRAECSRLVSATDSVTEHRKRPRRESRPDSCRKQESEIDEYYDASNTKHGTLSELAERLGNFHESANALADCLQTRDITRKTGQYG